MLCSSQPMTSPKGGCRSQNVMSHDVVEHQQNSNGTNPILRMQDERTQQCHCHLCLIKLLANCFPDSAIAVLLVGNIAVRYSPVLKARQEGCSLTGPTSWQYPQLPSAIPLQVSLPCRMMLMLFTETEEGQIVMLSSIRASCCQARGSNNRLFHCVMLS